VGEDSIWKASASSLVFSCPGRYIAKRIQGNGMLLHRALRICRRCLCYATLLVCAVALVYGGPLQPYIIPTGSMAPALFGYHRVCTCPGCGRQVTVGRAAADIKGSGEARHYRKAFCPNCGRLPLPVPAGPELEGDRVLVNKAAFFLRSPQRWEVVVFRLLGIDYIKRLLGLPGEEVLIHDGDVYVNGRLLRKTFAQAKRMRLLVFEQKSVPLTAGIADSHFLLRRDKWEPIRDEYSYNAGLHANSERVHDFLIETEIEVSAGTGSVTLRLQDGHDWVEVLLPAGQANVVEAFSWPATRREKESMRKVAESERKVALQPGHRHQVEMGFVDRRLTLVLNGETILEADLSEARKRGGVACPFQVQAEGVQTALHSFRLCRDVHYGQQGTNAVRGKSVRLGVDQYFVLGDNSPNSHDSRHWPDQGRVPARALVGSAWLTYGPSSHHLDNR
jgi:signal peptidase I